MTFLCLRHAIDCAAKKPQRAKSQAKEMGATLLSGRVYLEGQHPSPGVLYRRSTRDIVRLAADDHFATTIDVIHDKSSSNRDQTLKAVQPDIRSLDILDTLSSLMPTIVTRHSTGVSQVISRKKTVCTSLPLPIVYVHIS